MNVIDELRKLNIEPYFLSREEYEAHYQNLYNVIAHPEVDLYWAIRDALLMRQLRQAQEITTER